MKTHNNNVTTIRKIVRITGLLAGTVLLLIRHYFQSARLRKKLNKM